MADHVPVYSPIAKVRKATKRPRRQRPSRFVLRQATRDEGAIADFTPPHRSPVTRRAVEPARSQLEDDRELAQRLQKEALGLRSRTRR